MCKRTHQEPDNAVREIIEFGDARCDFCGGDFAEAGDEVYRVTLDLFINNPESNDACWVPLTEVKYVCSKHHDAVYKGE